MIHINSIQFISIFVRMYMHKVWMISSPQSGLSLLDQARAYSPVSNRGKTREGFEWGHMQKDCGALGFGKVAGSLSRISTTKTFRIFQTWLQS